jgi:hypothetical protein
MGVDLCGRGVGFNWSAWVFCLDIAKGFGWVPLGTVAPENWNEAEQGVWGGGYFTNDLQWVTKEDAVSLAHALDRAIEHFYATSKSDETEDIVLLRKLSDCAKMGGFAMF